MRNYGRAAACFAVSAGLGLGFGIGFGAGSGSGLYGLGLGAAAQAATEAVCTEGDADAKIACLGEKVSALTAKLADMQQEIGAKADAIDDSMPGQKPKDDIVRYDSVIAIRNQDMRIFPRCLDNPGPDSPNLSAVLADSCAPAAGQSWIIMRALD